ncbi:glycosyl hydrolase family 76-domain-containing protein [Xylaria venustula]|nr:glycosyl hydrolase family 76-domain-containing protein [Xylaria venustula]
MLRVFLGYVFLAWTTIGLTLPDKCTVFFKSQKQCDPIAPASFLPAYMAFASKSRTKSTTTTNKSVFHGLLDALNVTQSEFFAPWLGTWPDAIDWTAAVIGTHISGATRTVSEDVMSLNSQKDHAVDWRRTSNLIDKYFTQLIAYYFGQDSFAIRYEAYDDILWVVLGWLEAVKFVNTHSDLHYADAGPGLSETAPGVTDALFNSYNGKTYEPYHGNAWLPAFSHRARVFWDLAERGWDTKLCNGGMVWNPRLLPYKNAITNELFIAASVSMYFHFPGDNNASPFHSHNDKFNPKDVKSKVSSGSRDARYLKAAVEGYRWLRNANMTNDRGLIVDGFHISGYLDKNNNNTRCDTRDEMVYTYNQGVILTGQRGLWDATGAPSFLTDGHYLIQNVIEATGYNIRLEKPVDDPLETKAGILPRWHGLGRLGIMEDTCDASGTCSQDGQTFKGIFFHHLTAFCAPLEPPPSDLKLQVHKRAFESIKRSHAEACRAYSGWLRHNVLAATKTQDDAGRFGQWWTAGLLAGRWVGPWPTLVDNSVHGGSNRTDYRNYGVPVDTTWRRLTAAPRPGSGLKNEQSPFGMGEAQTPLGNDKRQHHAKDPNDRGRGRTVETQSGGLGLLRAYWKIAQAP